MLDSQGNIYNVASGETPTAPTKQDNYVVRDCAFPLVLGINLT